MKLNSMQNKIVEVTYRIAGDEINEQLPKMMALRIKAFTKSVLHDSIYLGTWTTVRTQMRVDINET